MITFCIHKCHMILSDNPHHSFSLRAFIAAPWVVSTHLCSIYCS